MSGHAHLSPSNIARCLACPPAKPLRRPEAIALEELVAAASEYQHQADEAINCGPRSQVSELADARLVLALNAARNALRAAGGHAGSVG